MKKVNINEFCKNLKKAISKRYNKVLGNIRETDIVAAEVIAETTKDEFYKHKPDKKALKESINLAKMSNQFAHAAQNCNAPAPKQIVEYIPELISTLRTAIDTTDMKDVDIIHKFTRSNTYLDSKPIDRNIINKNPEGVATALARKLIPETYSCTSQQDLNNFVKKQYKQIAREVLGDEKKQIRKAISKASKKPETTHLVSFVQRLKEGKTTKEHQIEI